jgi:hypothetical protein
MLRTLRCNATPTGFVIGCVSPISVCSSGGTLMGRLFSKNLLGIFQPELEGIDSFSAHITISLSLA